MLSPNIIQVQQLINSGLAWTLEGSVGRACMAAIQSGDAMLGRHAHRDYWGNYVPGRGEVQPGTKGSQLLVEQQHGRRYALALAKVGDTFEGFQED
jgi:hypothetical protein